MRILPSVRFWNLLRHYKREIRLIYLYAILVGAVNLTLPLGIQAIINFLQTGEMTSTWLLLVGFVLFGISITGVFQVFQLRIVENIQQELFAKSAFEFAYRIPNISFLQLDRIHAPELVNRFFDTLTIQKGLPKILIDFSLSIFQIVFGLILLSIYSSYFIILGVFLALMLWLIFKVTGPKGLETSLNESKYKYYNAHWLEEIARMNRSFKVYGKSKFHLKQTDELVEGYVKSREKHFKVLLSQYQLFVAFKVFVAAALLLLGGYLVLEERMNIGQFVAAEIVIILIINSIEKVLRTIETIYDVLTGLDKIGYITDLKLDSAGGTNIPQFKEGVNVEVKNLSFAFPEDKNTIIDDLSFRIESNEKVVLSGKSGSGKSILLQILAGIHEQDRGKVLINDIPFLNYKRDELYTHIGVSFPINQIFEGSIKDNILLGRSDVEKKLDETIQFLRLKDFTNHLPKGVDTVLDSGGRRLPRSIIQKILIARIIINEPKLLLMEDPLLFVEEEEKKRIIDYMMSDDRKWTILVISDFYYWRERSNRLLKLDQPLN